MTQADRPNILLIVTDQQRFDTIAAAGNSTIRTPNLDRLCRTGVRFTRAYTESPECAPARAAALTGKWGHQTGVLKNGNPMQAGMSTFVSMLKDAGYWTQAFGTLDYPQAGYRGLRVAADIPASLEADDFLQYLQLAGFGHVHEPHGVRHAFYYVPQVSQLPDEHHVTTWVGNQSVDFIKNQNQSDAWFLLASFMKPHPPFDPTIPFLTLYDPEQFPLPVRGEKEEYNWLDTEASNYYQWMESADLNLARLIKAAYYASITQIDVQIGRMLDCLALKGLLEKTLIVFVSDHGEMLGDHYRWGKGCFYEGASHIPFILSWPGCLPEGEERDQLVGHRDLAPTMLAAAGLSGLSAGMAGMDLLPIAKNENSEGRRITFGEYSSGRYAQYMAVNEEWKYIYKANGGQEALFRLTDDPYELHNRINCPEASNQAKSLRKELIHFFRSDSYFGALSADCTDLISFPYQEAANVRGRQYAKWTQVHTFERSE